MSSRLNEPRSFSSAMTASEPSRATTAFGSCVSCSSSVFFRVGAVAVSPVLACAASSAGSLAAAVLVRSPMLVRFEVCAPLNVRSVSFDDSSD